jgi:hypothetical protein
MVSIQEWFIIMGYDGAYMLSLRSDFSCLALKEHDGHVEQSPPSKQHSGTSSCTSQTPSPSSPFLPLAIILANQSVKIKAIYYIQV